MEAVQKRAAHPVYGYGMRQQPYYDAVMGWLKKRHGFEVNYEHLAFAPPGVIYALNVMLRILTKLRRQGHGPHAQLRPAV